MACGCGCKSKVGASDGLMSGLLGALMGELAAGSRVRVGFPFQISHAISSDEIDALEPQIVSYIQGPLYNYLDDGVTFSDVKCRRESARLLQRRLHYSERDDAHGLSERERIRRRR